ncbi:MAG: macro domain-containing protein [Pirellula sp.]|jgi:O-acetyl-ADP-ribose deacetylase (regulator of RNase III)|nr:macro domain-containing protein [Pirellula sp.]
MKINVKVGDVLSEPADVLISSANPWLNLSGGVNGAIREAVGPDLQTELHELLKQQGMSALPAGTVVRSNAYTLPFKHILHAVAIDPFYDSSTDLVKATFEKALDMALELQALTVSSPTLATGYGPMSISDFVFHDGSNHQWWAAGGSTAIGKLASMVHPVQGAHQEHVPPRSEIELELRRNTFDNSIQFLFAGVFKPRHELLVHGSKST